MKTRPPPASPPARSGKAACSPVGPETPCGAEPGCARGSHRRHPQAKTSAAELPVDVAQSPLKEASHCLPASRRKGSRTPQSPSCPHPHILQKLILHVLNQASGRVEAEPPSYCPCVTPQGWGVEKRWCNNFYEWFKFLVQCYYEIEKYFPNTNT